MNTVSANDSLKPILGNQGITAVGHHGRLAGQSGMEVMKEVQLDLCGNQLQSLPDAGRPKTQFILASTAVAKTVPDSQIARMPAPQIASSNPFLIPDSPTPPTRPYT